MTLSNWHLANLKLAQWKWTLTNEPCKLKQTGQRLVYWTQSFGCLGLIIKNPVNFFFLSYKLGIRYTKPDSVINISSDHYTVRMRSSGENVPISISVEENEFNMFHIFMPGSIPNTARCLPSGTVSNAVSRPTKATLILDNKQLHKQVKDLRFAERSM